MSEYRIDKLRRELSVLLRDGSRLEGDVFLRPLSRHRSRPEDPAELLNDPDPFFALMRSGEAVLVAKSLVTSAVTTIDEDDALDSGALGVQVEVTLHDGSSCDGSIFIESRHDRPRLLDFLNSYRARFLPIVSPGQLLLVNTQSIAHVREVA